jgi:hypothetical protein
MLTLPQVPKAAQMLMLLQAPKVDQMPMFDLA